uniref:Uncharacterized protein n=1 Tax=Rhizophora mucronata TaxID=61149 RepID=A0A2P2N459_RHIMU
MSYTILVCYILNFFFSFKRNQVSEEANLKLLISCLLHLVQYQC